MPASRVRPKPDSAGMLLKASRPKDSSVVPAGQYYAGKRGRGVDAAFAQED